MSTGTQHSFLGIMDALNKRMEQFEDELRKTPPAGVPGSDLISDFSAFKTLTIQILREFQSQLGLLAQNVDNVEMNSRRKFLLFHGVPEDKKEDTKGVVVNIVNHHLKFENFTESAISRCQRMGRITADRPRPILVKFKEYDVKCKLWSTKTALKGTQITLSEFLTKARHQTFMQARERFGVKSCWTRDGYIYINGPDEKRHRICSIVELQKIQPGAGEVLSNPAPSPSGLSKKTVESTTASRPKRGAALAASAQFK